MKVRKQAETAALAPPADEAETLAPAHPTPPAGDDRPAVPGFEIVEELGRGGMGVVYKARQVSLNRFVALKLILAGPYAGADQLARFRVEAESVARLQHPGIVQIHEIGSHAGHSYLALEYVPGGTLNHRCAGRPLPPDEAARLVEALARAVHYAHQRGIIHRDLKPGNVLLTEDGQPKITDFGLAKRLDGESGSATPGPQTQSGAILGTPAYMAPEQAGGKRGGVGPPADVYALGAILYELLTGRPPFQADSPLDVILKVATDDPRPPRQVEPGVPRDLEAVCLKCLQKDPARRYASAQALADDLGRFLKGEPTLARPAGRGARFGRWAWRRRWWLAGCGTVTVLLLVLLVSLALNAAALLFVGTVHTDGAGPPAATPGAGGAPLPPPDGRQPNGGDADASSHAPATTIYRYVLQSTAWVVARPANRVVMGTGSLIDRENRLVLTSYHIVQGAQDVTIFFPVYGPDHRLISERAFYLDRAGPRDAIKGEVLAHDKTHGLALIRLTHLPDGVDALPFAKAETPVGADLHCVGNPGASDSLWVYLHGNVRSVQRKQWTAGSGEVALNLDARVVEADLRAGPGCAGAPCVNDRGELVGVVEGGLGGGTGITFCIERGDIEAFIGKAFKEQPDLRGKTWARPQRPSPGGSAN